MTTRANWFLDIDLSAADEDDPPVSIEEIGEPFDLRDPASLQALLTRLLHDEQDLYNEGVRCALKQEHEDVVCAVCPVRHTASDDPMTALCKIGVEEERVATELRVATCHA